MQTTAEKVEYGEIEAMRELYRDEARCQVVHDSALRRALSDPYLIYSAGKRSGYGGVWTKHYPNRIMEFYVLPHARQSAAAMFRALITASGATHTEAQTNMPLMLTMLYDYVEEIAVENLLFEDTHTTRLTAEGCKFRRSKPGDGKDANEWVLEADGAVIGSGGVLYHYNPPYGDVYMEIAEQHRRNGYGSYLVQELKRVCYEGGHRPAARCNPDNTGSRLTLQRAGFSVCGRMLAGKLRA
jgi:GNAT superfamily N-acetyltransferase